MLITFIMSTLTYLVIFFIPYNQLFGGGRFEMKEFVNDKTGYMDTQTLITPKGKETFRLLCI